jgi:hypothetical protein
MFQIGWRRNIKILVASVIPYGSQAAAVRAVQPESLQFFL